MRMRTLVILLAASVLAACGVVVNGESGKGGADIQLGEGGWTVQIAGDDANQSFLVTGPDGKQSAARVTDGTSALIAPSEAQALMAISPTGDGALDNKVSIQAPGFSLKVDADDANDQGRGRVSIKAGGVDVFVDGEGDDANGRGRVRIAGLDADSARKFIEENDDLSADTKAKMREQLGL